MTEREIRAAVQDIRDRHLTFAEGWAFCSANAAAGTNEPDYTLRVFSTQRDAEAAQQSVRNASSWEWQHTGSLSTKIFRLW